MKERKWIDISQPLTNGIAIWPGDIPFSFKLSFTKEQTGSVNIGQIHTGVHTGTHIDAPYHFDEKGERIHELDVNIFVGKARVIDVTGHKKIGKEELVMHDLEGVERLLLKTCRGRNVNQFPEMFTVFRENIGPFFKEKGIRLLGTDGPSVDAADSKSMTAHHSLNQNGVYILENIVLTNIEPADYELIALPLAIEGADASPVRAVLRML
ncbi:arylformamidase [Bacillus sp. DTU_2020_1000418_1_SI_GHA_SEK_038]|uniref:arylformamidase n=1 Tax=Bacillus sp. DTU_2020_1000418_1_SI_GHA_SEK_038 TaxID=3077585 RepID=UPI0028ED720F|nr:arylformamidase [Bacillus sp. DTU_2020_1000418_1_SI_GHA_SEK_038]WNS75418.1 arylformamidase [Bacillus sp. DTU_2020_1000418_1_SI_GHA_SEK_038]